MLPSTNLPVSFERVRSPLRQCFTAPTNRVFLVLFCGFVTAVGDHTVTGMLVASGYSTTWSHHRGHRFFSRARWYPDAVGMAVLDLTVDHLLPGGSALELVVDDSLFKRSGPKVWGVFWHHDATSTSTKPVAPGTCYLVVGVVVNVRFMTRATCLPVHVRLWTPKPKVNGKNGTGVSAQAKTAKDGPSKVDIATAVVRRIAGRYPTGKPTSPVTPPTSAGHNATYPRRSPGPTGCAATPRSSTSPHPRPACEGDPKPRASGYQRCATSPRTRSSPPVKSTATSQTEQRTPLLPLRFTPSPVF